MNLIERIGHLTKQQKLIAAGVAGVVLVAGAGTAVAMSGGDSKAQAVAATPTPIPTPTVTPAPTPVPTPVPTATPVPVNPLTGLPGVPAGPVIAVKIDDTAPGRPQVATNVADIVYIEQAEGGLTRDVAVFASQKPTTGYIRSVRTSDPELLSQYGPIILVATGGGGDSLPTLDSSIVKGYIMDRGAPGFHRVSRAASSYINVVLDLAPVNVAGAGGVKDMGWVWNADAAPLAAAPAATTIATRVGGTDVGFSWDAGLNKYVRVIGGARQVAAGGAPIATPNVIVQFCQVSVHPGDVDVNGNPAQYTHSVGSGPVTIFRNARRIDGSWSRAVVNSPTSYKDAAGNPIAMSPGGAWIVLATAGAPLTSG